MSVSRHTRSPRPTARSRCAAGGAAVLAALVLGAVFVGVWRRGESPADADEAVQPARTAASSTLDADQPFESVALPLVKRYCVKCHGEKDPHGEISLHQFITRSDALRQRKIWTKALEMLESGMMPPDDAPQPTAEERKRLLAALDETLFHVECDLPRDPGRVTVRRLNRAEYDNTIRDLLGVDLQLADDFPSDDVGEGFDNIGDVLSLSPLLFEKYLAAAEQIADEAIVAHDPTQAPRQRRRRRELQKTGGANLGDYGVYNLYSSGSVSAEFEFSRDGRYVLRVEAGADQAGPEVAKMDVSLDGDRIKTFDVKAASDDLQFSEIEVPVKQGRRRVEAAFVNDYYKPDAADPNDRDRNLYIRALEVVGPVDVDPHDVPESHKRLVVTRPGDGKSLQDAAAEVLRPFVRRAFRRPVTDEDVAPFVQLVELAAEQDDTFERGIQVAVTAVLISPQFLFRIESDADPHDPARTHRLNDFELATRLSYFLWSSMPDDELFDLAEKGTLHDDATLAAQVRRMLQDERASALSENFAAQWLNLRNLDEITPDPAKFDGFDDQLRRDMRRETLMFFETVMREDRSIVDFLDGRFTVLNERLARHYGLPGVDGDQFRKVELNDDRRGGVLTQASILTLTSNPTRTSPVKRGKWIMENILGTPPPDPPANVPDLGETQKAAPDASLREQLEIHRKSATCAVCHRQMDALGFGFENFDAIGRWRDRDGAARIDASGVLPSGESFAGPAELIQILRARQDAFSRALTEKMLTYALGRGLAYFDRCAVDTIVQALQKDDYRFSTLVTEIVQSEPFRMRRGDGGE